MEQLLGNSKQQVNADGNPYLREDYILAGSVDALPPPHTSCCPWPL